MERLTYRIGDKTYLKRGLDGKWEKMDRYDVIQNAVKKLAAYEDQEEFFKFSADQVKDIMAERDTYKLKFTQMCNLMDVLRIELLGSDYYVTDSCGEPQASEAVVNEIINRYGSSKKTKKWWNR